MKHFKNIAAVGIIAAFAPLSANALGISVQTFPGDAPGLADAQAAYTTEFNKFITSTVEDFEGLSEGQVSGSLGTSVGDFTSEGGTGSGTSQIGDGTNIAVREDGSSVDDGGRFNTTVGGDTYLDSNDTLGINWVIPGSVSGGVGLFDRILFNLVDVADQNKILSINATDETGGNSSTLYTISGQSNSTINTVLISFDSFVSTATLSLKKSGLNDGFSIDDATVGAVPLPAAAWLLMFASGGLIAAKRRSARRAA